MFLPQTVIVDVRDSWHYPADSVYNCFGTQTDSEKKRSVHDCTVEDVE